MKIRYRWHGPLAEAPMHGCVLASARGRGAYLIIAVNDRGAGLHVLTVERISRAAMNDHGPVYGIVWDKRGRQTAKRPPPNGSGRSEPT
jgi:hypothetical protein